MTPSPNTTQPRSSPQQVQWQGSVEFMASPDRTEVVVDIAESNFTDYKLYAASNDPEPRKDTEPLDESQEPPAAGRLIGDGFYTEEQTYTVQVTFLDENQNLRYVSATVAANDARPNTSVSITLT